MTVPWPNSGLDKAIRAARLLADKAIDQSFGIGVDGAPHNTLSYLSDSTTLVVKLLDPLASSGCVSHYLNRPIA